MPSQPEIDNILALTADYQTKKAASDEAQRITDTAIGRSTTSRASWEATILDGESDTTKLTAILTELVETSLDMTAKQTDSQEKSNTASQAKSALDDAIFELTIPPETPVRANDRPSSPAIDQSSPPVHRGGSHRKSK